MASRVNIVRVEHLNNPAMFNDQFRLEITFEVFEHLPHDLEWELVYVGSGTSRDYDQVLDSALVGPIPEGRHKFVFDAEHPDIAKIPTDDIVGVSVLLLRCKYNDQEFINMGWFVANEYADEQMRENPPAQPVVEQLTRRVEIEDLRVTTFPIRWTDEDPIPEPAVGEEEQVFKEEDLMPLNDEGQEDEDDDDDDEDEDDEMDASAAGGGEIDLNESFNERMAKALEVGADAAAGDVVQEGDEKEEAEEAEKMEQEPVEDVEMGDDDGIQMSSNNVNEKETVVNDAAEPLADKTNNAVEMA